jgi:hypothetical protein
MPSTVKVRIKSARNLPVMDHVSSAGGGRGGNSNNVGGLLTTTTTNRINNLRNNMGSASPPSTDAYVVVTLGGHVNLTDQEEESGQEKQKRYQQKTKVCRRTLNPVWDEGKKKGQHIHWNIIVVYSIIKSHVFASIVYINSCFIIII